MSAPYVRSTRFFHCSLQKSGSTIIFPPTQSKDTHDRFKTFPYQLDIQKTIMLFCNCTEANSELNVICVNIQIFFILCTTALKLKTIATTTLNEHDAKFTQDNSEQKLRFPLKISRIESNTCCRGETCQDAQNLQFLAPNLQLCHTSKPGSITCQRFISLLPGLHKLWFPRSPWSVNTIISTPTHHKN